jgi:5-(carboxyamino)imidazole ribonucleotide mutase
MAELVQIDPKALVSVLVGSKNDWPKIEAVFAELGKDGIPYDKCVLSAHRDSKELQEYLAELPDRKVRVIITAAGMSNALSGTVSAFSELPVIGIPIKGEDPLETQAALLSTVMMPSGKPVATLAPNAGKNAAILAKRILTC